MSATARRSRNDPRAFVDDLIDEGSFLPLSASPAQEGDAAFGPEVITGLAQVEGRPVAIYAIDPQVDHGFVTSDGAEKIVQLMGRAESLGVPVVAFLASAGVSIKEGLASGDAYTRVITSNIRLSGVVPQIAVVTSVTMGAPAYSATLQDFVLFNARRSHLMVTGPAVVSAVLGQTPTLSELGGAEVHGEVTGIVDFVDRRASDQLARVRALLRVLPSHRLEDPPRDAARPPAVALPAVPEKADIPFDMREFIDGLVDADSALELGADHATSMITVLARLGGHVVGVLANQSLEAGGAITAAAARKGARFLQRCDAFNIPILNLIDVPGFMPGVDEEQAGLLRQGARLCQAMTTSVPRLSVVVRRCYGAAAFVMLQTRSQGGEVVLALEGSRIAVMGFDAARRVVYADEPEETSEDELRARYYRDYESPAVAARAGLVDQIVTPDELRDRLASHLDWLARRREPPRVERKHIISP